MNEAPPKEVRAEEVSVEAVPSRSSGSWTPVIAMIILMPLLSYGMTEYLLIPRIKKSLEGVQSNSGSRDSAHDKGGGNAAKANSNLSAPALPYSYSFQDIVVNLSGANGTRYLKVSFTAFSASSDLQDRMTRQRNELVDLNLRVLSARTLADLEAPGARNLLRNDLIENLNQALGGKIIEQVYFTDFVVQ